MFDIHLRSLKDKVFDPCCQYIPNYVTPLGITACAHVAGLLSCSCAILGFTWLSVTFWFINRAFDCLDGALARRRRSASYQGGFLDLLSDFIIYSLLPISITIGQNGTPRCWEAVAILEAAFHVNNFILFYVAAVAEKTAKKDDAKSKELTSVTMRPALIEGMESGVLFTLMLAFPSHIESWSWLMAGLVAIGIVQRTLWLHDQSGWAPGKIKSVRSSSVQAIINQGEIDCQLAIHPGTGRQRIMSKVEIGDHVDVREERQLGIDASRTYVGSSKLIVRPHLPIWRVAISLVLLFLNYFLAQYDKFILSYFQREVLTSLKLSQASYGILSGYATGIVYALLALPAAYIADYTEARVWVLTVSATWWSLCAIFQGLSHNFWQILLARIGMGIGQAPVEALSVSLISDLMGKEYVFLGESILYVGVYIGEAVSGQIAVAFAKTNTPWNTALIAIGIVGVVVAVSIRLLVREPARQTSIIAAAYSDHLGEHFPAVSTKAKLAYARGDVSATFNYLLRMRSFWLLVLSASFRQLSGNVFGYYMPTYLSTLYPSKTELLSRYGIIVGTVGSVAVLLGGLLTFAFWRKTKTLALYLVSLGGMISAVFVLLMLFSLQISGNNQNTGVGVLYGTMSAAYMTAELWLGAINSLIILLLPPRYKTFALSIWDAIQVLVYASGPEIIGLALRNVDAASAAYLEGIKICLAVIIPVGYWLAGIGFLLSIPLVKRDLAGDFVVGPLSRSRKLGFALFGIVLGVIVIVLFVVSIVYKG